MIKKHLISACFGFLLRKILRKVCVCLCVYLCVRERNREREGKREGEHTCMHVRNLNISNLKSLQVRSHGQQCSVVERVTLRKKKYPILFLLFSY